MGGSLMTMTPHVEGLKTGGSLCSPSSSASSSSPSSSISPPVMISSPASSISVAEWPDLARSLRTLGLLGKGKEVRGVKRGGKAGGFCG